MFFLVPGELRNQSPTRPGSVSAAGADSAVLERWLNEALKALDGRWSDVVSRSFLLWRGRGMDGWNMWHIICIHTYIPTYIHTYLPTYIHTYLPTYIHTYIDSECNMHMYICVVVVRA